VEFRIKEKRVTKLFKFRQFATNQISGNPRSGHVIQNFPRFDRNREISLFHLSRQELDGSSMLYGEENERNETRGNEKYSAYQNGPETPYCQATLEDWRRVAAQVHCDTITDAVSPVLIIRPAVLKRTKRLIHS
jgi:hypothetical protein